jgi:hypothetical protein
MNGFNSTKLFKEVCKLSNKWGLYLNYDWSEENSLEEILKAAPFLTSDDIIHDKNVFLFDTENECRKHYDMVVGDDGPTKSNSYNGSTRVYALTCDNTGQFRTENT